LVVLASFKRKNEERREKEKARERKARHAEM